MTVTRAIRERQRDLSPAERKVADVIVSDPERVAFGTVAVVAAAAGTGGATVVRLADRLGYEGFRGLQAEIQAELSERLRPAAERIREPAATDVAGRALAASVDNLTATLGSLPGENVHAVGLALADRGHPVWILAGTADRAPAVLLGDRLALLRGDVEMLTGTPVDVARALALVGPDEVVVAIDLRRYERWVLEAAQHAAHRGARVVAITDSLASPLARVAWNVFVVRAVGVAPFDSAVGTIALTEVLVAEVARHRRDDATTRLAAIEAAWQAADVLVDR